MVRSIAGCVVGPLSGLLLLLLLPSHCTQRVCACVRAVVSAGPTRYYYYCPTAAAAVLGGFAPGSGTSRLVSTYDNSCIRISKWNTPI